MHEKISINSHEFVAKFNLTFCFVQISTILSGDTYQEPQLSTKFQQNILFVNKPIHNRHIYFLLPKI